MRFPSRLLLAGSVLGVLTASCTTALTLGAGPLASPSAPATPVPDAARVSVDPADGVLITATTVAPPDPTTAGRADLDASPGSRPAPSATPTTPPRTLTREEQLQRLRDEVRRACANGTLHGRICAAG